MVKKKYILTEGIFDSEEDMQATADVLNKGGFAAGAALKADRMRAAIDAARQDGTMRTNKRYAHVFAAIEDIFEGIRFVPTLKELDADKTFYVNDNGTVIISYDRFTFYEDILKKMLEYEQQGTKVRIAEMRGEVFVPHLTEAIDHLPSMFPQKITGVFRFSFFDSREMDRSRIPAHKVSGRRFGENFCTRLTSTVNLPTNFELCDTVTIGKNIPEFDSPEMIGWASEMRRKYGDKIIFASVGNLELLDNIDDYGNTSESFGGKAYWRINALNEEFDSTALNTLLQKPENKTIFRKYARHSGILWSEVSDYQVKKLTTEYDYGEVKSVLVHNKTTDGSSKSGKYKAMICTDNKDKITAIITGGSVKNSISYIDPKIKALLDYRANRLFKYRDVITKDFGIPTSSFPRGAMAQKDRVSLHMFLSKIVYLVLCGCKGADIKAEGDFATWINFSDSPSGIFDKICDGLKIFSVKGDKNGRYMYYVPEFDKNTWTTGPIARNIFKGNDFDAVFKFNNTTNDSLYFLKASEFFDFPVAQFINEKLMRSIMVLSYVSTESGNDKLFPDDADFRENVFSGYKYNNWFYGLTDEQREAISDDQKNLDYIITANLSDVYDTLAKREVRNSLLYSLNPGSDIYPRDPSYSNAEYGDITQFGYLWMIPDFISRLYVISSAGFNSSGNDEFFDKDTPSGKRFANMTPDEQLALLANRKEERRADWHVGQEDRKRMQDARERRREGMVLTSKEVNPYFDDDFAQHQGLTNRELSDEKLSRLGVTYVDRRRKDPMRFTTSVSKKVLAQKFNNMPTFNQIDSLFSDFKFMKAPLEKMISSGSIDDEMANNVIGAMCNLRKTLYIYAYIANDYLSKNLNSNYSEIVEYVFNAATKTFSKFRTNLMRNDNFVINDMMSTTHTFGNHFNGVNLIRAYYDKKLVMPLPILTAAINRETERFKAPHLVALARKAYNAEVRSNNFEI